MQKGFAHLILIAFIGFFLVVGIGYVILSKVEAPTEPVSEIAPVGEIEEKKEVTAGFAVYTNGTRRNFTAAMYIKQSPDVYVMHPDPSIIHVTKDGITWSDFFGSLPMSLTNDCLTTGTGEKFCNGDGNELTFFLNTEKVENVLDKEINQDDFLEVRFE